MNMGVNTVTSWVFLFGLIYLVVCLFWARTAARQNGNYESFFSAGHSLSPWVGAIVMAGASVSSWFILGTAQIIARDGFVQNNLLLAGVLLALPGVVLFKRTWFLAQRYRVSSQAELFQLYYKSLFLVVVVAAVALLFAVGFAGMQLLVLSELISEVSGRTVSAISVGGGLSVILFGYVLIGGMRAIGYIGVLQTVVLISSTLIVSFLILLDVGAIRGLNSALSELNAVDGNAKYFEVSGVIQFVKGLGRAEVYGHASTASMNLSAAYAIFGFGVSPIALKIILSMRSTRGIAAGQTWILSGFFGLLIVLPVVIMGAAGLVQSEFGVKNLLIGLATTSPWFVAWILLGFTAGMQLVAGLALLLAAETLIRHLYKPYLHSELTRKQTVTLTRITVVLLSVLTFLIAFLAPISLSMLGAFALPASAQLITPMVGLCWFGWMTRPAVITGVGFGLFAAFTTDALGIQMLHYLGLDIPWGRHPWTIHSAAWGLFFNFSACLIVTAASFRLPKDYVMDQLRMSIKNSFPTMSSPELRNFAWAATLVWGFLAVGPGLVLGGAAFLSDGHWILDFPSLWAWSLLFWLLGVGLVWFLSYRMEMASHVELDIESYSPRPVLRQDQSGIEKERRRNLIIATLVGSGLIILIVWGFGGSS